EIAIAKRIEEGLRELMAAMASFPGTVDFILKEYEQVEKEEKRLGDVITGYLDTNEAVEIPDTDSAADEIAPAAGAAASATTPARAATATAAASDDDDSEDDDDSSSDDDET